MFAALGQAIPDELFGAPAGTSGNLGVGGFDPAEEPRLRHVRDLGRRLRRQPRRATASRNGCSTIGISKTTPIEIMEQLYPVLFEEYSLHEGSGGAGEHRGGFGVNYRIRLRRGEARVSMVMDHGRVGPPGAQGGGAGGINKVADHPRRASTYVPPHLSKDQDIAIHAGDVIAVSTPGGGGFGPARRAAARGASRATSRSATTAPTKRDARVRRGQRHDGAAARSPASVVPARASTSAASTRRPAGAKGACARSTRSPPGARSTTRTKREVWKRLPARRQALARPRATRQDADVKALDFWFDPVSPYAYLAFERLPEALAGLSYSVAYRPVLFGALLKHCEPQGPGRDRAQARLDLPPGALARPRATAFRSKRRRAIRSTRLRSRASPGPPRPTARTPSRYACETVLRHVWQAAAPMPRIRRGSRRCAAQLAPRLDPASDASQAARCATPPTRRSREGVFGVPTLEVDGRLFWGFDALTMLAAYLRGDPWFDGAALAARRRAAARAAALRERPLVSDRRNGASGFHPKVVSPCSASRSLETVVKIALPVPRRGDSFHTGDAHGHNSGSGSAQTSPGP